MTKAVPLALITALMATGCVTNPYAQMGAIPPEVMAQIEQQRAMVAQMMGKSAGAPKETAVAVAPAATERELLDRLNALPAPSMRATFDKKRSGLAVDGATLIDPEGEITGYSFDATDGRITYLVKDGAGSMLVKATRAGSLGSSVLLGRAVQSGASWRFESVTGKKLTGSRLLASPGGVIMARDTSVFTWRAGEDVKSAAMPDNFTVAQYQGGDIGGTRFILIEKMDAEETNKVLALFDSAKKLVGANKKLDYALFGLDSGKVYPFNIDVESNKVIEARNCQQTKQKSWGSASSGCQFASWDALYEKDGSPNRTHYYWRVHWLKSANGPIAVVQENGLREIVGVDLTSGKRVNLFSRTLGIANFNVSQDVNGNVAVAAQLGFSRESVGDVGQEISSRPELPPEQG